MHFIAGYLRVMSLLHHPAQPKANQAKAEPDQTELPCGAEEKGGGERRRWAAPVASWPAEKVSIRASVICLHQPSSGAPASLSVSAINTSSLCL